MTDNPFMIAGAVVIVLAGVLSRTDP